MKLLQYRMEGSSSQSTKQRPSASDSSSNQSVRSSTDDEDEDEELLRLYHQRPPSLRITEDGKKERDPKYHCLMEKLRRKHTNLAVKKLRKTLTKPPIKSSMIHTIEAAVRDIQELKAKSLHQVFEKNYIKQRELMLQTRLNSLRYNTTGSDVGMSAILRPSSLSLLPSQERTFGGTTDTLLQRSPQVQAPGMQPVPAYPLLMSPASHHSTPGFPFRLATPFQGLNPLQTFNAIQQNFAAPLQDSFPQNYLLPRSAPFVSHQSTSPIQVHQPLNRHSPALPTNLYIHATSPRPTNLLQTSLLPDASPTAYVYGMHMTANQGNPLVRLLPLQMRMSAAVAPTPRTLPPFTLSVQQLQPVDDVAMATTSLTSPSSKDYAFIDKSSRKK